MSRLDWFTIVLVTLLLGALGFLIYKTVQLIQQDDNKAPKTELSMAGDATAAPADDAPAPGADDQDLDDDELTYDPQEIEAPAEKETTTTSRQADTNTNTASEKKRTPATEPSRTATAEETTPKGGTPTSYSSTSNTGAFMVVAGSFSLRHNADNQVDYLKKMGYKDAKVEMTQNGALASAMVGRFSSRSGAQKLVEELKGKGIDAIVKKQD